MGHRALVASRQDDGTFTVRYAHWGRDLAEHLTDATPLGGPVDAPDASGVLGERGVDPSGGRRLSGTRVDPTPLVRDADPETVLAALDATFESLVVVSPTGEAETYLVCSLDPATGGDPSATGDLVLARPDGDPESLRAWFVEAKSRLSRAVATGALAPAAARATLRRSLAARATVRPTDDASFLRDG